MHSSDYWQELQHAGQAWFHLQQVIRPSLISELHIDFSANPKWNGGFLNKCFVCFVFRCLEIPQIHAHWRSCLPLCCKTFQISASCSWIMCFIISNRIGTEDFVLNSFVSTKRNSTDTVNRLSYYEVLIVNIIYIWLEIRAQLQ